MLYGPILMESLAPGNKGLLSPGPREDMLYSGKVLLKVTCVVTSSIRVPIGKLMLYFRFGPLQPLLGPELNRFPRESGPF